MSAIRGTVGPVLKAMRRLPRLFAAVLTFILRAPRLVLEAGSRVDHREAMDRHIRAVWASIGSEMRVTSGDEAVTVAGRSDR